MTCHDSYPPEVPGRRAAGGRDVPAGTQCHDPVDEPGNGPGGRWPHVLQLEQEAHGAVVVLRLRGRLDWCTAGRFTAWMAGHAATDLVLDCSDADTDAAGTAAILAAAGRAHADGQRLVLVVPDPCAWSALWAAGLPAVAATCATLDGALEWFATRSRLQPVAR